MTVTGSPPCLSQHINAATRPLHTHLNALIINLLPLALPPHTSDPGLYAEGMSHILPIYESYETSLRLLQAESDDVNNKGTALIQGLQKLLMPQLERNQRLRNDIEILRRRRRALNQARRTETSQPAELKTSSELTSLTAHLSTIATAHPHLHLSYTWLLYMALFSGGRHIRRTLRSTDPSFWDPQNLSSNNNDALSFWTFNSDNDGEDIKAEFKRRFSNVEVLLTEREKEEVVTEAVWLMERMDAVVKEAVKCLGEDVRWDQGRGEGSEKQSMDPELEHATSMPWLLLKHVLPMGVAELTTGAAKVITLGTRLPLYWNSGSTEAKMR